MEYGKAIRAPEAGPTIESTKSGNGHKLAVLNRAVVQVLTTQQTGMLRRMLQAYRCTNSMYRAAKWLAWTIVVKLDNFDREPFEADAVAQTVR